MSKCTHYVPKNALLDFHIPMHCNGINNLNEVRFVLCQINKLILDFEKQTSSNGNVLGVTEGNWFDNPTNKDLSNYKHRLCQLIGINGDKNDWRIYGCTLTFKSDCLKVHKDKFNGREENFSMVVVFNATLCLNEIPPSVINDINTKCGKDNNFLNMTIVVYGRQVISNWLNKFKLREKYCQENVIIKNIVRRVLSTDDWGYENWLYNHAGSELKLWIKKLHENNWLERIKNFRSDVRQDDNVQLSENTLFDKSFFPKKSMFTKQLYWSSFASVFFAIRLKFTLSDRELWDVFLFIATEVNGQCVVSQLLYWHILPLRQCDLMKKIKAFGSMFALLSYILIHVVNR